MLLTEGHIFAPWLLTMHLDSLAFFSEDSPPLGSLVPNPWSSATDPWDYVYGYYVPDLHTKTEDSVAINSYSLFIVNITISLICMSNSFVHHKETRNTVGLQDLSSEIRGTSGRTGLSGHCV